MHHFCLEVEGHAVIVDSDKQGPNLLFSPAKTTYDKLQGRPTFARLLLKHA